MEQRELWQFVPVNEYAVPETGVDRVRKGLLSVLGSLAGGRARGKGSSPLDPEQSLLRLQDERLELALPKPDWKRAGESLHEWLRPWLESPAPDKPAVFFVAPPDSGREELLLRWASGRDVAVVEEPTDEQILGGDAGWLDSWPREGLWLLPRLERCFLRSTEGLDLVRELIRRLFSGKMGQAVVGCDSWAWSFLTHVGLGRPSFTVTAQAFDADRMRLLFARGIRGHGGTIPTFRQADNGAYLLRAVEDEDEAQPGEAMAYWRRLAECSRGNIGVAAAYWRRALRTVPERDFGEDGAETRRPGTDTIWVTSWDDLERSAVPAEAGETARFVLHALLLHGGLDSERLASVLPAHSSAIGQALGCLAEAQLVEARGGRWRVTPWGYPAVRTALCSDDYLSDSF